MASHSAEPYWRRCLSQTWFPLVSGVCTIITGLYAVKRSDPFLTTFGIVSGIATVGGAMYSPPTMHMLRRVRECLISLAIGISSAIFPAIIVSVSAMTNIVYTLLSNAPRIGTIILTAWMTTMTSWDIEQGRPSPNNPIIITPPPTATSASRPATNPIPRYEAYQATTATGYTNGYQSQDIPLQFQQYGSPTIHPPPMASIMRDELDLNHATSHVAEMDSAQSISSRPIMRGYESHSNSTADSDHVKYWDLPLDIKQQSGGLNTLRRSMTRLNNYVKVNGNIGLPEYTSVEYGPQYQPTWMVAVFIDGQEHGKGFGPTKCIAKETAAAQALERLLEGSSC